MVQSLGIHSYALYAMLYKPLTSLNAGTCGIVIVCLGIIEKSVHSGVKANNLALQVIRINAACCASCIQMLVCDQAPGLNVNLKNYCLACISIDRHLVCVTSTSAVELILHNVSRSIAVCTGMHGAHDALGQNAALCHGMCVVNEGLIEIRPSGNLCAKRMCKIYIYFCHVISPFYN